MVSLITSLASTGIATGLRTIGSRTRHRPPANSYHDDPFDAHIGGGYFRKGEDGRST